MPPDFSGAEAEASVSPCCAPPPLAALFLVRFDRKVGYTIAWRQCLPSVPLDGVVEFKSLPSGLHNVDRDLVYFVHERWAGVSAFRHVGAREGERGASFVAVGALVAADGRLGRVWEHAPELERLADLIAEQGGDVDLLREYWDGHRRGAEADGEDGVGGSGGGGGGVGVPASPFTLAQRRSRAVSSLTVGGDGKATLPDSHPAHSVLAYLDTFGPLVFPLHRLALLRKRILLVTRPPVRSACEFVYDLSIFSALPHSLDLQPPSLALLRSRPLFSVGVHDIPHLSALAKSFARANGAAEGEGTAEDTPAWIATTTDEIIATKTELYDVLVELPQPDRSRPKPSQPSETRAATPRKWPTIRLAHDNSEIKATQRDLRRYRKLRRALSPLTHLPARHSPDRQADDEDAEESTHLLFSPLHSLSSPAPDAGETELRHRQDEEKVTERPSWSELAYHSFIWWAAAGEREDGVRNEEERDGVLLGRLGELASRRAGDGADAAEGEQRRQAPKTAELEVELIAYFQRLSASLFDAVDAVLAGADAQALGSARDTTRSADRAWTRYRDVEDANSKADDAEEDGDYDQEEEEEEEQEEMNHTRPVFETEDLRLCGLDRWSPSDAAFLADLVALWFGREIEVRGGGVECCGLRI